MTDQMAVVAIDTPSATGTLDITSPNITEAFSAAVLIFTKETSDGTDNAHGMLGIGFIGVDGTAATDTLAAAITLQSENGVLSAQDGNTLRSRDEVAVLVSSGVDETPIVIQASFDSAISGGVRLNFTVVGAGPIRSKMTVLLFAGLAKAATGDCTFNDASSGLETVGVSPGWEPDLVIFRSSDTILNGNSANATLALGFAVNRDPIQQVSAYVNWDDRADPTDGDGYLRSDACSSAFIGTIRTDMDRFSVLDFNANGFEAQASDTGGLNSPQANYLALKFSGAVRIACANLPVAGTTGLQAFNTFGFTPDVVLGMSTLLTSVDTLTDGATTGAAGYFITGFKGSRAYTVHSEEGLNIGGAVVSNAHTRQEDVALLTYAHTGSIAQRATWGGTSGPSGFLLNFSTATAGYLTALGLSLGLKETENVTIGDELVVSPTLQATETVSISDDLSSRILLEAGESVLISDSFVFDLTTQQLEALRTHGVTALAGVARASTVQAGTTLGTTAG